MLTRLAVKRPVAMLMVVAIVLILAVVSFTRIPIDLFPDMDVPVVLVQTSYQEAGPHEVENIVTRPLEESLSTVDNLSEVQSISSRGSSQVILMFDWATDMDSATQNVREQLDMVRGALPDDADDPMVIQIDPNMMPIMYIGIEAPYLNQEELSDITESTIEPELEQVENVGSIDTMGGVEREINVYVDSHKLNSYSDIGYDNISGVIQANNMDMSGGMYRDGEREFAVRTMGEFDDPDDIKSLQIGMVEGTPVEIQDVARVEDEMEDMKPISRINQQETIALGIMPQSGANTVSVAGDVHEELDNLEETLPGDITFQTVYDESEFIVEAIDDIVRMGFIGAILAMLILWLFLGRMRTTLIIGIAIPISIIGTFNLMYFQDYTVNILTLGGLALGIGMVVDSSIIMLENIFRKREAGEGPYDAALNGSKEITGAIIASTFTTVAAFLPAAYTGGIASLIFEPLAWTVVFALLASLIVALTIIPVLSVKFFGKGTNFKTKHGKLPTLMGEYLSKITDKYGQVISWSIVNRGKIVGLFVGLLIFTLLLTPFIGFEFLPDEDAGELMVEVEYPRGTPHEMTMERLQELEKELSEIEEIDSIFSMTGEGDGQAMMMGSGDDRSATFIIMLEDDRERDTFEVAGEIRGLLPEGGGISASAEVMGSDPGGGMDDDDVDIVVKGDDLEVLEEITDEIAIRAENVPGVANADTSFEDASPELQISINNRARDAYGLTTVDIGNFIRRVGTGEQIGFYREAGEEHDVNMKVEQMRDITLSQLESMLIGAPTGDQVPIGEVADIEMAETPTQIQREDRARAGVVSVQVEDRDVGRTVEDIDEQLEDLEMPSGYILEYGGAYEMMIDAFEGLGLALALAIVLVYGVMAAQFESLLYPFIIMFSMPQAVIGVILGLLLTGYTFSIVAFIGVIMLAGIVVNNGIVMVDFINQLYHQHGYSRTEALINAGKIRLRPILMTVLTTILGMLPLALSTGEGAEMRAPMAVAIIGGLAASTLVTLVLIPVVYSLLDDFRLKTYRRFANRKYESSTSESGGDYSG